LEANLVRDTFFERGLGRSSIQRQVNSIRAIINFLSKELSLADIGTFSGIYLGENDQLETSKRQPIPLTYIQSVQQTCKQFDDEARWLVAQISDTGMRLGKATGLHKEDVRLNDKYPHLILRPHP
jgi:integrase